MPIGPNSFDNLRKFDEAIERAEAGDADCLKFLKVFLAGQLVDEHKRHKTPDGFVICLARAALNFRKAEMKEEASGN